MAVDDIETDTELLIGYLDSDMEADEDEQPPPAKREEEGEGARGPGTPGSAGAPSRRGAEGVGAAGGARSGLLAELARSAPLSGGVRRCARLSSSRTSVLGVGDRCAPHDQGHRQLLALSGAAGGAGVRASPLALNLPCEGAASASETAPSPQHVGGAGRSLSAAAGPLSRLRLSEDLELLDVFLF